MMSRSRQDIRSHLDDLATRHPEFADHLRCPPWGGEVGSSQNRGQHKESDCDDDSRSQASGISSSSSEPHGTDRGAQGPLPHYGLRNTVDLGQKQQEADQEEKQVRGQRSMSAPPDNRSQQLEQPQRFVSRVEIPMNAAGAATDASGRPPVAQKQQSTQQSQNTSKQPGNVRHIPIFVEGRDEPILPKNVPEHVEQVFPPRTTQPEVEHIFSPRQTYQPPQSFARPSQFYPQQTFVQQSAPPASPKQQRHMKPQQTVPTKSEHSVPIKVQQASHSPKTPTKSPSKQEEHTIPIKVQHTNTSRQSPKSQHTTASQQPVKPPKPPEPMAKDPISRVKMVQKDVEQLRSQVQQYSGTSRKDKEYIYLDEMLTRNLLKLDDIDTEGKENVRLSRKEVIKMIQQCISELEAKVPVPEEVPPSEEQESMEEVPVEQGDEKPSLEESTSGNVESGEMELAPIDNAATTREKQEGAEVSSSDKTANTTEEDTIKAGKSEESKEVNQQKEEKEFQEMPIEDLHNEEVPKNDAQGEGDLVNQSAGQDVLMECAEDIGTAAESLNEMVMPVEGVEDKMAALANVEVSKSAVGVVEDKTAVNGAGDSKDNTNIGKNIIPMEIELKEANSSELQRGTESKESGSIPEQQPQQFASDSSSEFCDKEVKSG